MDAQPDVAVVRSRIRDEIKRKFADLVRDVKRSQGSMSAVAAQIGVTRQALAQYADGSVPQSDVLLMALFKWDWSVRVENLGKPSWCEFSISDMEGGPRRRRPEPLQLPLFDALTEMDHDMETLKKSVGRVEFEVRKAFGKRA